MLRSSLFKPSMSFTLSRSLPYGVSLFSEIFQALHDDELIFLQWRTVIDSPDPSKPADEKLTEPQCIVCSYRVSTS